MSSNLATHYKLTYGPKNAAGHLAKDLMRSDPGSHKQGYTLENAVLAAAEVFDISTSDVREQLERI